MDTQELISCGREVSVTMKAAQALDRSWCVRIWVDNLFIGSQIVPQAEPHVLKQELSACAEQILLLLESP